MQGRFGQIAAPRLTVNGQATRSGSATRWFATPSPEDGKNYYYRFEAKFARDGRTVRVRQKVPVRAGRETVMTLRGPDNSSAVIANRSYYYNPQPPAVTNYYYYSPPRLPTGRTPHHRRRCFAASGSRRTS